MICEEDSHTMLFVNLVRLGGVLASRVFATSFSWREEDDGSFLIAWAPVKEYASRERVAQADESISSDAAASQATRATTRGFFHFKALALSVCQVTYVSQANLGGSIPKAVIAFRTKQTLGIVQKMQAKFERKGNVVDAEMRSAFPLPPPLAELNDVQKRVVESCRYLESEEGGEWEPLNSSSPLVDMWCKHTPAKKGERSIALGKATAGESSVQSVDLFLLPPSPHLFTHDVAGLDCSAHHALAYFFAAVSRERMRISSEQGDPARLVQRRTGSNDFVWATIKKMPFSLRNREFVARQVAATDTNGDFLVVAVPTDEVIDYRMKTTTVRGVSRLIMRLVPEGHDRCKVTYHIHLDAGGRIPTFVVNSKLPLALGAVDVLLEEFQRDDDVTLTGTLRCIWLGTWRCFCCRRWRGGTSITGSLWTAC